MSHTSTSTNPTMSVTMAAISKYIAACFTAIAIAGTLTEISVAASPASDPGSPRTDEQYEQTLLGHLRSTFLAAKKPGRLYYVVPCNDPEDDFPPFPEVKAQAPLNNHSGLDAVRDIFRDDKRVTVSEESDGPIRVRVGQMPDAILRTKIPVLRLSPLQQYDTTSAIFALTDAKAVQAAMHKLGLREVASVFSIARNLPAKTAPHLPAVIKNVTLDQALDLVAKTFGVVVIFGECTDQAGSPRFMRVHTIDLQVE